MLHNNLLGRSAALPVVEPLCEVRRKLRGQILGCAAAKSRVSIGRRRSTLQVQALALVSDVTPQWPPVASVKRLAARLGRRLVVKTVDMPPEMTVAVMATATTDYVFVTGNADLPRRVAIVAYEVAHILLGCR